MVPIKSWETQAGLYRGQEESITQPTEGVLGAETNYHLRNSSSNVNNEIGDETGDITLAAADVDISKSLTYTNGVQLQRTAKFHCQMQVDRPSTIKTHIFTEDELECVTQWFSVDPSVWIYKNGARFHPVIRIEYGSSTGMCTKCNNCVGCTSCYNCYDHTYSHCEQCDGSCVTGCDENCTSGCTTTCVGGRVSCTTDERSINWLDDDDGCTPGSQSCDDGCYGPGAVVGKCGQEVEEECDGTTGTIEHCDECRYSCQGGCQAGGGGGCQTCSVGTAQRSTPSTCSFTPCDQFDCPDCNGCTNCLGDVDKPDYQPCKHDTGKIECEPPCVSTVAQLPVPEDYCRNKQNRCLDATVMRMQEKTCTPSSSVACLRNTGTILCIGGAEISCLSQNTSIPRDNIEDEHYKITECPNDVDYIWCQVGVSYNGILCKGDCNTSNYGTMCIGGQIKVKGTDPTECQCSVGSVTVAQIIPNPPKPACGQCDASCVKGCDGCTSGCTTSCVNGCVDSCVSGCRGSCTNVTGCSGTTGGTCIVCTAQSQTCGGGQGCPSGYNPDCPDYCPGCTSSCAGGVPGSHVVSPNPFTGYC